MCLEQQVYASQENLTQPLVVMVETFKRSGCKGRDSGRCIGSGSGVSVCVCLTLLQLGRINPFLVMTGSNSFK